MLKKGESGFYFGFASDGAKTMYFQRPKERTSIWLGPWEVRAHPPSHTPEAGHLLFGEWEVDKRRPGSFRLKWFVSALDLQRFRACLEKKNMIFVRRPTSSIANAMLCALIYGDDPEGLSDLQRKQLAHLCCLPLDFFFVSDK